MMEEIYFGYNEALQILFKNKDIARFYLHEVQEQAY